MRRGLDFSLSPQRSNAPVLGFDFVFNLSVKMSEFSTLLLESIQCVKPCVSMGVESFKSNRGFAFIAFNFYPHAKKIAKILNA